MFNALTALGWGVVTFAITIGVGTVVLAKFGGAVSGCPTANPYNETVDDCQGTGQNTTFTNQSDPTGSGWVSTNYLAGQLGTSGLAGWTPAIIAFAVGMLFLGGFLLSKEKSRKY